VHSRARVWKRISVAKSARDRTFSKNFCHERTYYLGTTKEIGPIGFITPGHCTRVDSSCWLRCLRNAPYTLVIKLGQQWACYAWKFVILTDSEIHSFSHWAIMIRAAERIDSEIHSFSHWAIMTRAMERIVILTYLPVSIAAYWTHTLTCTAEWQSPQTWWGHRVQPCPADSVLSVPREPAYQNELLTVCHWEW